MDKKRYFFTFLKGMGMGAADVVPGVSGGTIALITGIYETFVNALKSFSSAPKVLFKEGFAAVWKHINGPFLLALGAGIGFSLLALVKLIKYALEFHPVLLWSFFFGLIVASSYYVGKQVKKWNTANIIALLLGAASIFYLTSISPSQTSESALFIFFSGMVAICAMILPGISGAFILVLIGKYQFIINSLSDLNIKVIVLFALGCGTGLLSFSHLLSYLLKRYHDLTIAILTGFMIGSLQKIWPWKNTLSWTTDRHGESIPYIQENVLPADYLAGNSNLSIALILAILGIALLIVLDKAAAKKEIDA